MSLSGTQPLNTKNLVLILCELGFSILAKISFLGVKARIDGP